MSILYTLSLNSEFKSLTLCQTLAQLTKSVGDGIFNGEVCNFNITFLDSTILDLTGYLKKTTLHKRETAKDYPAHRVYGDRLLNVPCHTPRAR